WGRGRGMGFAARNVNRGVSLKRPHEFCKSFVGRLTVDAYATLCGENMNRTPSSADLIRCTVAGQSPQTDMI
ncbi:MAG: hypothetical protein OXG23_03905, partial [Chloroflexi bacterium]|nr:hypothetical protein [Chloroflexota bacterium]